MAPAIPAVNGTGVQRFNASITATRYVKRSLSLACSDSKVILGCPRMSPFRLKLTRTVMSIAGLACDGRCQQLPSLVNNSLRVSTGADEVCADTLGSDSSSAATSQANGLCCRAAKKAAKTYASRLTLRRKRLVLSPSCRGL